MRQVTHPSSPVTRLLVQTETHPEKSDVKSGDGVHKVSSSKPSPVKPKDKKELGTLSNKKNDIIWEFFPTWGGGLPKSQNFCKFTKYFFVCQIHSEVLKHVLQMGG